MLLFLCFGAVQRDLQRKQQNRSFVNMTLNDPYESRLHQRTLIGDLVGGQIDKRPILSAPYFQSFFSEIHFHYDHLDK